MRREPPETDSSALEAEPTPSRTSDVAAARRRLLVGAVILGAVAIAAVIGVGGAIGAALEVIADRSGAGADEQVRSLIARARWWGSGAALAVVGVGLGMFAWMIARHERTLTRMQGRLDTQRQAGEDSRDDHRRAVVDGLVRLAAARDGDTGDHLQRVREYVRALAEQMRGQDPEIDEAFIETLVQTAPLHDIGKVGVPDEILLKPGPLTAEQRSEMQKHVLHGLDTLIEVKRRYGGEDDYLRIACEVAFAHHERFDGTGYPFGLEGDTIPLSARIVALADVYDALRNERVYKQALDHETARAIITSHAGTHFDPAVVQAFLAVEDQFVAIAGPGVNDPPVVEVEAVIAAATTASASVAVADEAEADAGSVRRPPRD